MLIQLLGIKLGKGWILGSPKAEDLSLERLAKEFTLTKEYWKILSEDNWHTIKLLLSDEGLNRMQNLDKLSSIEVERLKKIRNSLQDKNEFLKILSDEVSQEILRPRQEGETISLFWYWGFMLIRQGIDDHKKFLKKNGFTYPEEKKKEEPISPYDRKEELIKNIKKMRELTKDIDVIPTMEQIAEQAKKFPTDFSYKDVKNPEEYRLRGLALSYSMSEDYQDCIDTCNKGLEINPDSPYLLYMRGRTYSDMQRFEEGMKDLKRATELRDDFAEPWMEIGRIHQIMNHMDLGILAYYNAQKIDPIYKIYEVNPDGSYKDPPGSFPKFTQTLNEKGVKIVLEHIRNTPEETIDIAIDGYFAICAEVKLYPDYLVPARNIQLTVYSESSDKVRDWFNQLGQLLKEADIDVQLKDSGEDVLEIKTKNAETGEWLSAVIIKGHDQYVP